MRRFLLFIGIALTLSCGQGNEPVEADLEAVYGSLIALGVPGREPGGAEESALAAKIDSLGGEAAVESLLVKSMMSNPARWSALIDSVASLIH